MNHDLINNNYMSMVNIGSAATALKTDNVETGSVAEMRDPKIKHSMPENSISSKR